MPHIRVDGLAKRRLQDYRNNHRLSLIAALETCFPVVRQLVGDQCFEALAGQFVAQHPPQQGYLLSYSVDGIVDAVRRRPVAPG